MRNGQALLIGQFILLATIHLVHSIVNHILYLPCGPILVCEAHLEHGATAQAHTIIHELVELTARAHHIDDIVEGGIGRTLGFGEVDKELLMLKLVDEYDAIQRCGVSMLTDIIAHIKCHDGADIGEVLYPTALYNLHGKQTTKIHILVELYELGYREEEWRVILISLFIRMASLQLTAYRGQLVIEGIVVEKCFVLLLFLLDSLVQLIREVACKTKCTSQQHLQFPLHLLQIADT